MQLALDYICSLVGRIAAAEVFRSASLSTLQRPADSTATSTRKPGAVLAMGVLTCILAVVSQHGHAGQERYEYDPIGRLIRYLDVNNQVTEYTYDAAGNILSVTKGGAASTYVPALASITPNFIRRGESKALTLVGQHLQVGTLRASDQALDLSNIRQSSNQILADLTAGESVAVGPHTVTFSNAEGTASIGLTVGPRLPELTVEPSPLALPPDNTAHLITLSLSSPDLVAHDVAVASSDTSKATVSPASVSLSAGQSTVKISVTSRTAGFVNLTLTSATLKTVVVPVFITADFRGVNTSNATPVGVVVGDLQPPATGLKTAGTFTSPRVGITVGSVLTGLSPQALAVGASSTIVIRGANIPNAVQVSVLPNDGIALGSSTVSSDGSKITVPMTVDAAASPGARRIVVKDGANHLMAFADDSTSQLVLTSGQPAISSVEPLFATPGSTMRLKVRGSHLHEGQLVVTPSTDLRIDSQPVINAGGTELIAYLQISPLAATGARTVQVATPSGQSATEADSSNQFTLVREIKNDVTPIFAPPVGVFVGVAASSTQTITPVASPSVGVVLGAFAKTMMPKAGVVGTTVNLVVNGQGLQTVQSVSVAASTGLTLGSFVVNTEGTQLTLPVTIDASAPKTLRRLILNSTAGPISFPDPTAANFLVAAPVPQLVSVAPQVIKAGQTTSLTIRGSNFRDLSGIRFEPSDGLMALQPLTANSEGTVLTFNVQAAATAASGARTVMVAAAGGESSNTQVPENTLYVARQTGPTYADIMAQPVGVSVGAVAQPPVASTLDVHASAVGVLVESVPAVVRSDRLITASNVGVIVGSGITGMSPAIPDGLLKGSTTSLVFTGVGLDQATSARVSGNAAITLGALAVNPAGTQLTLPMTADSAVASGAYGVSLYTGMAPGASRITSVNFDTYAVGVGALPLLLESMSPIVLEQGKSYTFTVRGNGLKDVYQLLAEPATGVNFGFDRSPVQWSTDAFGEKLTARVSISGDAAIGSRVIRLRVPGGITDSVPVPANTITIVAPQ